MTDLTAMLRERLGLAAPVAMGFERGEVREDDGFTRERIEYRGLEGDVIPAFLFLPKGRAMLGGVVVFHQHNGEFHFGKSEVAGDVGIATFKMMLVNMLEGRFISPYDYEIAVRIATVLCGGEIDRGSLVDEDWLLKLERQHFVELAQQEKTQARIAHMLKTGKPLRN